MSNSVIWLSGTSRDQVALRWDGDMKVHPPCSSPLSDLALSVKNFKAEITFPLFLPPLIQIFVNIGMEEKFGIFSESSISFFRLIGVGEKGITVHTSQNCLNAFIFWQEIGLEICI